MKTVSRYQLGKGVALEARVVQKAHEESVSAINSLLSKPFADHVIIDDVVLTAATTVKIPHGLGRPARGYIVVSTDTAIDLPINKKADNTRPQHELWLQSATTATVSLLIF